MNNRAFRPPAAAYFDVHRPGPFYFYPPDMPRSLPISSRNRARRHERGATIAEVAIAATLLTFVILGAIGSISRSLALTNSARMVTLSSQVLQSAVEDMRLRNYAVIANYAAQPQPVDLPPPSRARCWRAVSPAP